MPQLLYYLPFLVCPVGMGLMMWLMMRGNKNGSGHDMATTRQTAQSAADRYLWREDSQNVDYELPDAQLPDRRTRDEQLVALHTRLTILQERQQVIVAEMREMQGPEHAQLTEREQRV